MESSSNSSLLPSAMDVVRLSSQVLRLDGLPLSRKTPLEAQVVDANLLPLTQRAMVNMDNGLFTLTLPELLTVYPPHVSAPAAAAGQSTCTVLRLAAHDMRHLHHVLLLQSMRQSSAAAG